MNKYTIEISHNATERVEIIASSKEEAIKKASNIDTPLEDLDFEDPEIEVVSVEEAPEYDSLDDAEVIVKKAYDNDIDFELEEDVSVTMWNGKAHTVESAVWDEEEQKIWVVLDDQTEHPISDLSAESQLDVALAIIDSADYNEIEV